MYTDFLIYFYILKFRGKCITMIKKFFSFLLVSFFIFGMYGANAAMLYDKELNSAAVYVVDMNTDIPIIEKNINERRSPASLTKMMTFIVAREMAGDINKTKVKVRQEVIDAVDPDSSGVKLKNDEEISLNNLFHAMLISSSGYAAMVIADYFGDGDISKFVDKMNSKAEGLGCINTHFANPDGFYDEDQYSTALDIYKITRYAMNIPGFLNIVSKSECNIFGDDRDPVITTNKMLDPKRGGEYYYPYVKGIKTGYLEEAGRCLVSFAQKNGSSYLSVVMGGPIQDSNGNKIKKNMAMIDTKKIYIWAFDELKQVKLYSKNSPIDEIPIELVWNHDKLLLVPEVDFLTSLPADFKQNDVVLKLSIPEKIEAPVSYGDVIGNADVFYKGQKIGSFNVVSSATFKKSHFLVVMRFLGQIVSSPIFMVIFLLFLVSLIAYLFLLVRARRIRKKRGKIKRFPPRRR